MRDAGGVGRQRGAMRACLQAEQGARRLEVCGVLTRCDEQEKKTAQEKLAKAHQQLIETLKEELGAGAVSLDKSKKLVSTFNDTGAAGLKLVRQAGETKMEEIRAHMASDKSNTRVRRVLPVAVAHDGC